MGYKKVLIGGKIIFMMDKRWFLLFGALFVLGFFAFSGFKNANVVLNYNENYTLGQKLSGDLTIGIEKGDSLDVKMPILVSLSKNGTIISSETLTLEDFIGLSGFDLEKVKRDDGEFYETPGFYLVSISKVINYTFNESGEYEMMFVLLDLDITKVSKINIS